MDKLSKRERCSDPACPFCIPVGVAVRCTTCGKIKNPVGRSAPLEMCNSLCDHECPGYRQDPKPGDLWPGELRSDFEGES